MSPDLSAAFWTIDFPPLLAASLATVACALVGNFLILTKRAMAADALSHSVVPGVVIAAIATGTTASPAMLAGHVGQNPVDHRPLLVSPLRVSTLRGGGGPPGRGFSRLA